MMQPLLMQASWEVTAAAERWWSEPAFLGSLLRALDSSGLWLPFRSFGLLGGERLVVASLDALASDPAAAALLDDGDEVYLSTADWPLDGSWIEFRVSGREPASFGIRMHLESETTLPLATPPDAAWRAFVRLASVVLPGEAGEPSVSLLAGAEDAAGEAPRSAARFRRADSPPSFDAPQALSDGRSWTAGFDSLDERHQDVYFGVTIWRGLESLARFMVQVDEYLGEWDGQDRHFDTAAARAHYCRAIAAVAADGRANCRHGTSRFPGAR